MASLVERKEKSAVQSQILLGLVGQLRQGLRQRDGLLLEESAEEVEKIRSQVDRELEVLRLNRSTATLHEIEAALDRINEGEYGICMDCGNEISERRLAALPWAARCIICQEEEDRRSSPNSGSVGSSWQNEMAA